MSDQMKVHEEYSMPEHDKLFEHEYDGIQEYDNPLPGWWINVFWATVVFSIGYVAWYHMSARGTTILQEYQQDVDAWKKKRARLEAKLAALSLPKQFEKALKVPQNLAAGRKIYLGKGTCWTCHGKDGGGTVGPNLTDDHWIHGPASKSDKGPTLSDIFKVISKGGRPGKGMIPWDKTLSQKERIQLSIFVASLRGKKPAKPKAPEKDAKKYSYTNAPMTP